MYCFEIRASDFGFIINMNLFKEHPQLKTIQTIAKKRKVDLYLVGGFLRDFLLGRSKLDFDFAVSKGAIGFAKQFAKEIKGAFVLLDQAQGCARVVKKTDKGIYTFDFADYRDKTLKKDLALRDFTVNTLCVDFNKFKETEDLRKNILDYQGALKNLKAQKIKMVSARAFDDDPLRMLRAYSLRALLNFKITPQTLTQIKKKKDLIRQVSCERIRDEFFKVLESELSAQVIAEMDKSGLLEKIIPQIRVMFGCKQGGYHHLDVWKHTLEALVQLEKVFNELEGNSDVKDYLNQILDAGHSRRSIIRLGLLLHDIGKPDTKKKEGTRFSFHGHEHVGKNIVRFIARQLKLSKKERFVLEDLVLFHLRPGYLSNFERPSEKSIYRFLRDAKEEAASVLILSLADQRATRGPLTSLKDQKHHEMICKDLLIRFFDKKKEKVFVPFITGHDLIKKLKLKPSPLFGKILSEVAEAQALGKVNNREDALVMAEKMGIGK